MITNGKDLDGGGYAIFSDIRWCDNDTLVSGETVPRPGVEPERLPPKKKTVSFHITLY